LIHAKRNSIQPILISKADDKQFEAPVFGKKIKFQEKFNEFDNLKKIK